ncbi:MAG: diguanylate cyclase [Desulfamplus sp.]|nr:diguanylate cyclase [Desulfamplus sp.]
MSDKRPKILIVDDTILNIQALSETLGNEYEVFFATNGKDALSLLESVLPDIILLDIMMPEMDGYTVCKKIKSNTLTSSVPVIFITAINEEKSESEGLAIGAIDYITKPFSPSIVQARVRNHIALKNYNDHLKNLSMIDGLTGISNRRYFDEYLNQEWHRAIRNPKPLSVIMMDIDFFKRYNDTYGHLAGDDCLKKVAKSLKCSVSRPADMVARYGGEEFICVLPETDLEGARSVAITIQQGISELRIPHENSSVSNHITLSIGIVTTIPSPAKSTDALIKDADELLYQAKKAGRNQMIFGASTVDWKPIEQSNEIFIGWTDELLTGSDIIDIQHKDLISRISGFLNGGEMPETTAVTDTINFLFDYVFEHFALEEKLMMQTCYPNFDEHLEQHVYYVRYIHKLKKNRIITRETINSIRSELLVWFLEHIAKHDCKMAKHLKQHLMKKVSL